MKKAILAVALVAIVALATDALAKKNVVRATGGTNIPQVGLVIDASYDPRLDNLVPGYKVINVVFMNQSFDIVALDPDRDRWSIKFAGSGSARKVIHDLRSVDPKAWSQLPDKVRDYVSYPLALPIGATQVIDLFVPDSVAAESFNELDIYIASKDTYLEILVRQ